MSNALAPARSRSDSSPDIRPLGVAPLLTPADLAAAWGVAADTVTALLREDAWRFGDLPVPMWIGPGSEHGPGWGRPRFAPHAVVKFLTERAVAAGIVPPPAPPVDVRLVLLDTRELAHVLAVPYDTPKKWAADRRWDVDEMPTPIRVCRGSGGTSRPTSRVSFVAGGQSTSSTGSRFGPADVPLRCGRESPVGCLSPLTFLVGRL